MFQRSTTSECGVTQHTTTTIQYERSITDGAKICFRKQRTKYDRRYDEGANREIEQEEEAAFPESRNFTRERIPTHTHYDSSPLTFGRHEEPMRNLFCTRNKEVETRRKFVNRRLSAASSWEESSLAREARARAQKESRCAGRPPAVPCGPLWEMHSRHSQRMN